MAQMNKKPGASRRSDLEQDLIGDIEQQKSLTETGKVRKPDGNEFHRKQMAGFMRFATKQGVRRRHPDRVLAQFAQIVKETSNAQSAWEQALMHEQERTEVPEEYKTNDAGMIVNQTGLVTTALDNFTKSKGKFERTVLTGV